MAFFLLITRPMRTRAPIYFFFNLDGTVLDMELIMKYFLGL